MNINRITFKEVVFEDDRMDISESELDTEDYEDRDTEDSASTASGR